MRKETQKKLELFAENAQTIKKGISMTTGADRRTAALLYAVKGKKMDRDKIAEVYEIIKKGSSFVSSFRDAPMCNAAMLSFEKDPKEAFDRTIMVYDMMKEVKFRSSPFLVSAALHIAAGVQPKDYKTAVARMRSFYDSMKAKSWLHTGADDYIFAAIFAISGANERITVNRIEKLFTQLKSEFSGKGSALALAQVMALGGRTDQAAVDRVLALRDVLKKRKMSLARPFVVPIIGILSQIDLDVDTIVKEARDVEIALKAQEGMGPLSISKTEVHMIAAAMVASTFSKEIGTGLVSAAVSTSAINMILAIQMAFIIIIVVAVTGAAAAAK